MRALVVCYAFPPVGGAGVQRALKLVKYLPHHDVVPSVLTVRDGSVPVLDTSLARDIPPGVDVIRTRTFEPHYAAKRLAWQAAAQRSDQGRSLKGLALRMGRNLLTPDPQLLWQPSAQWALARRLLSRHADDAVLITGPPFSQFLLAPLARLARGVGVVLDYRDEWSTLTKTYEMSGASTWNDGLERVLLRSAHVVTTATEEFREALLARFRFLRPEHVVAIPNGYDPEDFEAEPAVLSGERCIVTYTGTVFRLTSARGLVAGVRLLHEREPELARLLDVRFVGRIVETELDYFEGTEALGIQRLGYLEHAAALHELTRAHVALCILDELEGTERIYPAKIFEIMRLGRPCLALTPPGALARLVERHRLGEVVGPRDAAGIAQALERRLRAFKDGSLPLAAEPIGIERFDRRYQAGRFARVLRQARALARERAGVAAFTS